MPKSKLSNIMIKIIYESMWYVSAYIIVHANIDENHYFNNLDDWTVGGLWNWPLHG